jgi:hypothetical protein
MNHASGLHVRDYTTYTLASLKFRSIDGNSSSMG